MNENDNTIREADLVRLMYDLTQGVQLIRIVGVNDPYARGYAAGALEVLKVIAEKGPSLRVSDAN